jgi:hypothetical protein
VPGDLDRDMGRRAEAIQSQALTRLHAAEAQGTIADDTGAQQRRRLFITKDRRNRVGEALGHDGILGVSAIDVIAGERSQSAEILPSATAEFAASACGLKPGDADAIAFLHRAHAFPYLIGDAHCLVSGYDGSLRRREFAFHNVQVGPADAADLHAHANFTWTGFRRRNLL